MSFFLDCDVSRGEDCEEAENDCACDDDKEPVELFCLSFLVHGVFHCRSVASACVPLEARRRLSLPSRVSSQRSSVGRSFFISKGSKWMLVLVLAINTLSLKDVAESASSVSLTSEYSRVLRLFKVLGVAMQTAFMFEHVGMLVLVVLPGGCSAMSLTALCKSF